MKIKYIVLVLAIFAWPLYYLYELQWGAVSFLLLAAFFFFVTVREVKKFKHQPETVKKEKIKRNNR